MIDLETLVMEELQDVNRLIELRDTPPKNLAEELFDSYRKYDQVHDHFFDACLEILGKTVEDIPFDDITFDAYDSSFELKECRNGLELTAEQQQKFWELGFSRCWLCWQDGTEKRYGMST